VRRGDILIVSIRGYAGKPRPAVVVQSDHFLPGNTVAVCPTTGDSAGVRSLRPAIEPDATNNLKQRSWVMIDKVSIVEMSRIGRHMGKMTVDQMRIVDQRLALFLGLAAVSGAAP
jgi:mRNA interferase MazF